MNKIDIKNKYVPDSQWFGRSLDNYKKMQSKAAASNGVTEQLRNAKTLTEARKIVYGLKKKNTK